MPPKPNKSQNQSQLKLTQCGGASVSPGSSEPPDVLSTPAADVGSIAALKSEIVLSVRNEIAEIFKAELHSALGNDLSTIKSELMAMKTDLSGKITSIESDVTGLKNTVGDMEESLTTCTNDIVTIQRKMDRLSAELVKMENKCEDLESRSRRNNIRIVGVPEDTPSTTAAVSVLLKEAFGREKEPLLDRAHRTLQPKPKPGDRPRAIVARLHYYSDCADILRRARELKRIKVGGMTISVFPDHTAKIARARAAFNDVRRQLRDIEGLRFGILHPARLRVTYNGEEKEFKSPEEAEAFIKALKR